jgi:hypothetical protein
MALPAEGVIVPASKAKQVLDAAGIPAQQLGLTAEGIDVEIQGVVFTILERDVWYPPSETSPDGWHIVYAPSQQELEAWNPKPDPTVPDLLSKFLTVAAIGIAAYVLVNGMQLFKK